MTKETTIKERISYLRRGRKLSQEKMAQSLKISLNSYRKLESGSTRILNRHLESIAQLLSVDSDYLLSDNHDYRSFPLYDELVRLMDENKSLKSRIEELERQIYRQDELLKRYINT